MSEWTKARFAESGTPDDLQAPWSGVDFGSKRSNVKNRKVGEWVGDKSREVARAF